MDFPMNLVYDVVLGLLLLSILHRAWRQGFVASFVRLAGTAVGFLLASFFSRPVAEKLYDGFFQERVEQYVSDTLLAPGGPLAEALAGLDQAGNAVLQVLAQLLSERGLDLYSSGGMEQAGAEILSRITENGLEPAAAIAQVAVRPLVTSMLQTVVFFAILAVTGIAVRMIARIGLGVNRIPLVGGLNRLAGLACGAVYALLLGYVIAEALVLLAGIGGNRWEWLNTGVLRDTVLIRQLLGLRSLFS